ncbi:cupin domain-containing protein [Mycobacterium sp. MAA66]|uniref:cupin domain-containing protein n=1 Tax=Mycobacterium sp. MAA66 TaxID=3156297 RepID=UPI0035198D9C
MSETGDEAMDIDRRLFLAVSSLLAATGLAGCEHADAPGTLPRGDGNQPDPAQTFVKPFSDIRFQAWGNLPQDSGQLAALYGDLNKPGPYLVLMKWNPGWFSAPHSYATDRICVVVFGTWWVNSGDKFLPQDAEPVGPGGFVRRTAHTPHYDGVPAGEHEPAVIAIFGIGPVDLQLADPSTPSWRKV